MWLASEYTCSVAYSRLVTVPFLGRKALALARAFEGMARILKANRADIYCYADVKN